LRQQCRSSPVALCPALSQDEAPRQNRSDTGLLRLDEGRQVIDTFGKHIGMKLIAIDPAARFMDALRGTADREDKRRIIGREIAPVYQQEAAKLPDAKWLAQGTTYPDVIESAGTRTEKATTIKSHHNVGDLPGEGAPEATRAAARTLQGGGAQPRACARPAARRDLPPPVSRPWRAHSRRGQKKDSADLLRRADAIFIEELRAAGWFDRTCHTTCWDACSRSSASRRSRKVLRRCC